MSGRIQGADVKTEAELIIAGATKTSLITDAQIYVTGSGINKTLDDAIIDGDIGGGGGGINYITNGQANSDTTGWATYADAAGVTPVDGTGGAPSSTFTRSTSAPLRGLGSFLWTKSAANRQGEGFSYAFSIADEDKGKVLQGVLNYAIASGTYADDDMTIWIYDVTNAVLIQPAPYKIKNQLLVSERMPFEFQTSSSSNSYRLIVHTASTSASAYTLKFDGISVGPTAKLYGSPVTDPVAYAATLTNFGDATQSLFWWREGAQFVLKGTITIGASVPTGALAMSLPVTLSKVTGENYAIGEVSIYIAATNGIEKGTVYYASTTTASFYGDDAVGPWNATTPRTFAVGDILSVNIKATASGWSSSVIMSNDAATNVVAASYSTLSSTSYTTPNALTYTSKLYDTNDAYNTSTGIYTVPVPGVYRITIGASYTGAVTQNYGVYKNGSIAITAFAQAIAVARVNGSTTIQCVAGDTLKVAGDTSDTYGSTDGYLSIEKLSGPAQIAASETVAAKYSTAAGQSIANAASPIVDFGTKIYDYTGSVTTGASWKFTAPISGLYSVKALLTFASATFTSSNATFINVFKGGVDDGILNYRRSDATNASGLPSMNGATEIRLLAGEYLDVRVTHQEAAARSLFSNATYNYISITRVGNY